jgi:hypothetical protein
MMHLRETADSYSSISLLFQTSISCESSPIGVNAPSATANTLPSAVWNVIDMYNDPELLERVQAEPSNAVIRSSTGESKLPFRFDLSAITASRLLQFVYAEILRMHLSLSHSHSLIKGDYSPSPHKSNQGGFICVSTNIASNYSRA